MVRLTDCPNLTIALFTKDRKQQNNNYICPSIFKMISHQNSTWGQKFARMIIVYDPRWQPRAINLFNPIALRKAKIVYYFGLSECNRVKHKTWVSKLMLLQEALDILSHLR